ncbi:MAG: VWA domain-containing protein, partial [Ardenticatenaceae bacterium]|nr:VWA domain-containing protein [Ardenticatenaceae bacterium]
MIKTRNWHSLILSRQAGFFSVFVLLAIIVGIVYADNPATGTTTTGQELNIEILQPQDGGVLTCGEPINVSGITALGPLEEMAHVAYVLDISGSTNFEIGLDCNGNGIAGDIGDDFNMDGDNGDILDCEISGVISLNDSLVGTNTNAAVVGFGTDAFVADVQPTLGFQTFTQPLDADLNNNGVADVDEVVKSMDYDGGTNPPSSVGLFSYFGFGSGTDFNDALSAVHAAFASQPLDEQRVTFFLSDGAASVFTGSGSPLQEVADANIVVHTYSIGDGASGCGPGASLNTIATVTGGTCTEVLDPSDLSAVLGDVTPTGLDHVEVSLNSGTPITASLNALGGWAASFPPPVEGQPYLIEASIIAEDGTVVTADINTTGGFCATATPTNTATPTDTPVPPTATNTATPTDTPVPPTATNTATPTDTPVPPTATNTPFPHGTKTPIPEPTKTPLPPNNCTYTKGYWKNHPELW